MDTNNWRPTQGAEPTIDTSDWRAQLPPESRHRIVNKIMDTLKRHLPVSGQEGLHELRKIAQRFEEKIYTAATSQSDYLRKISLKMLTMETKSQASSMPSNPGANSNKPLDSGLGMQSQVHNPGQSNPINLANQAQSRQQLLSQNIQNNITPGVPSSAGIAPGLTPVSNVGQTPIQNIVPQQNISGQNSVGNTIGQGVPSNMFANSQRQMPGRQQVLPQQQQPQSQNPQYLYQQQLLKQKNIPHQLIQPHMQQQPQQQQNLLQSNQLQSSQQSVMQSSMTQSSSLSSLPQNQQSNNVQQSAQALLQQHQHPQSVIRQQQQHQQQQASMIHQQQTSMTQQPILPTQQQQQQHMGQPTNATNMQHAPLLGQQNSVGDIQQHQRLLGPQNNLTNLQQQQQQQQQQLLNQQNNLSNLHQQQLGSNVPGLQQQQLIGSQSGNSGLQASQHSSHLLQVQQSKVAMQQQSQQNVANLLPSQGMQSQPQAPQQQMMPQIQSQPQQLQQQLGLQQQPNTLHRDMQQRLASGSLLQQQNLLDPQKQLYQSQRALPETSSTSLDSTAQTGQPSGGDWQEEVYQKIKTMKEMYLPELNEMYQKIATKLQQHDSLPQQPKSDQLEKLKIFKTMLERIIAFLQVSKNSILPNTKEKLSSYEKQIVNFINTNKPRKAMPLPQGPLSQHHMHSMQQPQSQVTQVPFHENQMNSQLQSTNLQGSVATMQQNNMTNLQHNSMSSISGVSTAQQNMMNSMQSGPNLDSGQGNAMNSLQQVAVSSLQQNPVSMPQQSNINALTLSQGGVDVLQPNLNPLQPGSSMLQHPQLKQQQEQMLLNQQRQLQQQYMQRQMMQQQQQLQQPSKQQMPAQLFQNGPFLVGVADCSFVEETFGEISKKRCPQLSLYSRMVFIGMMLVIACFLWFYG